MKPSPPPPPAAGKASPKPKATAKATAAAAAKAKAEAAAKANTEANLRKARAEAARRKAAARRRAAQRARRMAEPPGAGATFSSVEPPAAPAVPVAARTGDKRDLMTSPLVSVLLLAAAALALISMLLAAMPLGTLERLLAAEAHYRTEQLASFVDGHRLDIAVGGVATLLVAAVVALPTVTG